MKSRISFFNLTVLRKDITQFAPLWGVYLIGGILILSTMTVRGRDYRVAGELANSLGYFSAINLVYAALVAQVLFGDLFQARFCNALHAMPLRREQWFGTHVIAGLGFSLVPHLIGALCVVPRLGMFWYTAFWWWLGMLLEYLFFFGVAVFSCMCVGNRVAMAAVYGIIQFAAPLASWFVHAIYEPLLYGIRIPEEPFEKFCPANHLSGFAYWEETIVEQGTVQPASDGFMSPNYVFKLEGESWIYLTVIALVGIALLVVALLMYRRRALESAGDFIAVKALVPVFSLVYTLVVGALFALVGEEVSDFMAGYLIIGLILGYFTGQMLLQRTVRVFKLKAFGVCGAILAVMILSVAVVYADPLGITTYVPKTEEIRSVTVCDGASYYPFRENNVVMTEKEDVEQVRNVHSEIIRQGEITDVNSVHILINIHYELADGRIVERVYNLPVSTPAAQQLKPIFSKPEMVLSYQNWAQFRSQISTITTAGGMEVDPAGWDGLLEAIKADCEAGNLSSVWAFRQDKADDPRWPYIIIESDVKDSSSGYGNIFYREVQLYADAIHTIRWLETHQDLLLNPKDDLELK